MANVTYPEALPDPQSAPIQSHERRLLSTIPGPRQSRALSRDRLASQRCTFMFTLAQAETFAAWWKNTLVEGGAWFASDWPHQQGITAARKFIGVPKWGDYVPGELWPVSAEFEVRGRGHLPGLPVYPCGVLCHFDTMDGGEVVSAIGPNFVPQGGADLSGAAPEFSQAGNGIFDATGITCTNDTSWRAEMFAYLPDANSGGGVFELGSGGYPHVRLRVSLHGMYADTHTQFGTASQLLSLYSVQSAVRFPVAIQYCCDPVDADYHRLFWFAEGTRQGEIALPGGVADHFEATSFGAVSVQNPDEFWLRYGLSTSKLYRETYGVPGTPFLPADPL